VPAARDGLRILLVEDHSDTKLSMEILLRRAGHTVRSAERAQDAIALAAQHEFDLVITDIGLPDMGGVDLMKRLHHDYGLTAIGTSGYGGDNSLLPDGPPFIHYLTKPINMEELRSLLTEFSAMKRQEG
jgi:CheY-like chemotaxis protein